MSLSQLLEAATLASLVYICLLLRDALQPVGAAARRLEERFGRIEQRLDYLADEVGRIETHTHMLADDLSEESPMAN